MKISITILIFVLVGFSEAKAGEPPGYAVASAQPLATQAGIEVLQRGGNAFDAAIAVSAALGVVEPASSGFGGGGFWLLHRASDGKQVMLDGRETAPALVHPRMYRDEDDQVIRRASLDGPLAAGIPGMPAALVHLAERYGHLPLSESLAPAKRYASEGFKVTSRYRRLAAYRIKQLQKYPATAAIFLQKGDVPRLGFLIRQTDLANTIDAMAREGRAGFYAGEIAQRLVGQSQQHGGIWELDDLKNYRVIEREPIITHYHDVRVVSAPPPSSGGIVMAQALQMLSGFELSKMSGIQRKHHIIEVMRRAYRDRAVYLGDPDFVEIPLARLLAKPYLDGLALSIDPLKATPSASMGEFPALMQTGTETTHFSVIDSEGNRVAGTLSINLPFGAGFVAEGTGVLFNNEMDDFSAKPLTPNAYGLIEDQANTIAPGKRPLSSMTPTFLETADRVAILGTPGGSRIISMVLLATLDFYEGQLPQSWVSLRRYHHQYQPDQVQFEKYGLTEHEQRGLDALGHELNERTRRYGNMQAILWDRRRDKLYAASDPRGEGSARVVEINSE